MLSEDVIQATRTISAGIAENSDGQRGTVTVAGVGIISQWTRGAGQKAQTTSVPLRPSKSPSL
jgi:hypothetical protein